MRVVLEERKMRCLEGVYESVVLTYSNQVESMRSGAG